MTHAVSGYVKTPILFAVKPQLFKASLDYGSCIKINDSSVITVFVIKRLVIT